MIILDEQNDTRLMMTLEAFKREPNISTRCIILKGMQDRLSSEMKARIVEAALQIIRQEDAQLYFADEGEIVLMATPLLTKEANQFILAMVDVFECAADESWIEICDVMMHINALLARVQARQEKHRKAEALRQKMLEQQQIERKRQSILNQVPLMDVSTIGARRDHRAAVELMMIEDDTFSTRLVENVLQKKYAITSLKEATYALDTYARVAPDLVFLDINLPDVTGHELLERMLAMDPHAHVIMLSGNADSKNITQAMAKGAKGFIAKPFTREKLFQYIDRCPSIARKKQVETVS